MMGSSEGKLGRSPQRAVEIYKRVFPERAPVQNILNQEGAEKQCNT